MAAGVLYPTMAQIGEWNEQPAEQPRGMFIGTPEIYFAKRIDNSRVAKVADPKRRREMISLGITLSVLFLFVMVYLWQHFSAIEYGYKIEQLKVQRDTISESNRALSLEEASLKDPARIDRLAKQMGMQRPAGGQLQPMETAIADPSTPVMAQANGIMVVSALP
ncbi:MAG: cell division protein FtsL [Candidatus Korobacteraceae bacterium]